MIMQVKNLSFHQLSTNPISPIIIKVIVNNFRLRTHHKTLFIKKTPKLLKIKKEIGQTARNTDFFCRVWSFLAILFVFGL